MKYKYLVILAILCGIVSIPSSQAAVDDSSLTPLSLEEIVTLKR
jgi:hypothetical protein